MTIIYQVKEIGDDAIVFAGFDTYAPARTMALRLHYATGKHFKVEKMSLELIFNTEENEDAGY